MNKICNSTNDYHEKKRNRKRRESHEKKWTPMSLTKLKAFFEVLLLLPLINKPQMKDYWSKNRLTRTPGISEIFSQDEFRIIKRNVHFCDEDYPPNNDPIYKIRPGIHTDPF